MLGQMHYANAVPQRHFAEALITVRLRADRLAVCAGLGTRFDRSLEVRYLRGHFPTEDARKKQC